MANICPCTFGNSVSQALNNLRKAKKLNQELVELSGTGTVLSRRVDTVYSLSKSSSSWAYLVTFKLGDEELQLNTTEEDYRKLKEGQVFQIFWKGDALMAFEEVATE